MVVAEGVQRLFVIFMMWVAERFELFGVTPWTATVLWRPYAYCIEDELRGDNYDGRLSGDYDGR